MWNPAYQALGPTQQSAKSDLQTTALEIQDRDSFREMNLVRLDE